MKKIIVLFVIFLVSIPLFAVDNGVIRKISGRVEFSTPGGTWETASVGTELPAGSSISTGFGSAAVVEVGAASLELEPLTRIKLEDLVQSNNKQTTNLQLRVGKVKAEVKRDSGLSHDFKLRSPSSTAAVRGTEFIYGERSLIVTSGKVAFTGNFSKRQLLVNKGEISFINSNGKSSAPIEGFVESSSTQTSTSKKQNNSAQNGTAMLNSARKSPLSGGTQGSNSYGTVVITISSTQ